MKDPSTGSFRKFKSPEEGYAALMNDLQIKVSGASTTGLTGDSTLYDFSQKYAPSSDNNNPAQYTVNLANTLKVRPDTKLSELKSRIPDFAHAIATNEDREFVKRYPLQISGSQESETPSVEPQNALEQAQPEQPKHGIIGSLVSSIANPLTQFGGSVFEKVTGVSQNQLLGRAEDKTLQGVLGDKIDKFGYRNNQALSPTDTAKQITGNVLQNAALAVAPELKGVGLLGKAGIFGTIGAAQGAGQSLEQGKSNTEIANQGLTGFVGGSALGFGAGLLGKGIKAVNESGILKGTSAIGEKAKNEYVSAVNSQLGKHAKGTGETMFDYGIDHNQSGMDAAWQIRNEIANPQNAKLTEVLKTQGNYTPIQTWYDAALKNIPTGTGIYNPTKAEIERHIADIIQDPRIQPLLIKNAEGGFSLPDWKLNELKQANWQNSKFNYTGDPATTIKANANLAMGRGARKIIEDATKGLDVGGFNKELGRLYDAADVLERKGDKPVFSSKTSHLINNLVGGMVGSHGGVITTLLGAKTADVLASKLADLPMFVRQELANKFAQRGKSQLFDEATTLLEKMQTEKASRLALPEGVMRMGAETKSTGSQPLTQADKEANAFQQNLQQQKNTGEQIATGNLPALPAPSPRTILPNRQGTPNPLGRPYRPNEQGAVGGLTQRITEKVNEFVPTTPEMKSLENLAAQNGVQDIFEPAAMADRDKVALQKFLSKRPDSVKEAYINHLNERLNSEKQVLDYVQNIVDEKVKPLMKYESKSGEYKGLLNFNTGKGKFGKHYDDILPEFFEPSGAGTKYAEDMVDEYHSLRDSWRDQKNTVALLQKELTQAKSFSEIPSPELLSPTKVVSKEITPTSKTTRQFSSAEEMEDVVNQEKTQKKLGKIKGVTIKSTKGVLGSGAALGGASSASALTNTNTEEVANIKKAKNNYYKTVESEFPMINKDYLKTLVARESSDGTNDTNRNADYGKYGWLVGFTKPTYQAIADQAKKSTKWKRLKDSIDAAGFDTPERAMRSAMLYSEYRLRDHTKEQKTGEREYKNINATQLYKLYNGGGSHKGVLSFEKEFNSPMSN